MFFHTLIRMLFAAFVMMRSTEGQPEVWVSSDVDTVDGSRERRFEGTIPEDGGFKGRRPDATKSESSCSDAFQSNGWWAAIRDKHHQCHVAYNDARRFHCVDIVSTGTFLSERQRSDLCASRCEGYEDMCDLRVHLSGGEMFDARAKVQDGFRWLMEDFESEPRMPSVLIDDVFQEWMVLARVSAPVLFSIIPILLNQWSYFNLGQFFVSMAFLIVFWFFSNFSWIMFSYNFLMWLLCLIADAGKSPIREISVSYALMFMSTFCLFVSDGLHQFGIGFIVLGGYLLYLYSAFFDKKNSKSQVGVIIIGQALVSTEQLYYVVNLLRMRSFPSIVLRMVMNVILPSNGTPFFFVNCVNLARKGLTFVESEYKLRVFALLLISQLTAFVAYRCCFGMYVITSLRFKTSVKNISLGGLMYTADIFGGVSYLLGCFVLNNEVYNSRRLTYSLVNVIMLVSEFYYAREFFLLRFIVWSLDAMFDGSYLTMAPRFLGERVSMRGRAFPQRGENAWFGLSDVVRVAKHVKRIQTKIGAKAYSGLGIVLKVGRSFHLMSIEHLAKGSQITVDDFLFINPKVLPRSGGSDPIVAIELKDWDKGGASLNVLTDSDIQNIMQVFVVSMPEDGTLEPMVMFSSGFKIDRQGDLRVFGSLKEGDSGGPLIAALNDGTLRYAGAVSRSTDERGVGHCYSLITNTLGARLDSDSDSDTTAVVRRAVVKFNKERGNLDLRLRVQTELARKAKEYGTWIVDVATEKGYSEAPDGEIIIDENHEHNASIGDEKINYAKRKKRFREEIDLRVESIKDLARVVFPKDEVERIVALIKRGVLPEFESGRLTHFGEGIEIIDDNPDDRYDPWFGPD